MLKRSVLITNLVGMCLFFSPLSAETKSSVKIGKEQHHVAQNSNLEKINSEKINDSVYEKEKIDFEAPDYVKLEPDINWSRYSCDSARSIKGWVRWWQYLRLKEPSVMNWIGNLNLRIYPKNEIFRALFVRGIYDPNNLVVINTLLKEGDVFIDAGANMGYCSLLASKVIGFKGKIIAIEPSKRDFDRLVDNIKLNHLEEIIKARKYALSNSSHKAKLLIANEERCALNTLGSEFSSKNIEKLAEEDVDSITLDKLVETERLAKVNLINLDIEGSEYHALIGANNTVLKHKPIIVLGINRESLKTNGISFDDFQKLLSGLKYKVYQLEKAPTLVLKQLNSVADATANVVYCLPEGTEPPVLPIPCESTLIDKIMHFCLG